MLSDAVFEVFRVFLKLGLTSFGGPIAHLGYYRNEFVVKRRWLDEKAYADLIALCQFLPGPSSSQIAFSIGLMRAGYLGGLAASTGFTLPSAVIMTFFAYGAGALKGPAGAGLLHGLKLAAVVIVAQAVLGMAQTLAPDKQRASIAALAVLMMAFAPASLSQVGVIVLGGLAGLAVCREDAEGATGVVKAPISRRMGAVFLSVFFAGLALSFIPWQDGAAALLSAFYRAAALVFGGGHVVLPLLRAAVVAPGWVSNGAFLAGYGAAQALPGPLFTIAAYLGAVAAAPPGGVLGALLALFAIFTPGFLALVGVFPFWSELRARRSARAALAGVNAAVVGLLASALYDPVWTSTVGGPADYAVAAAGFALLVAWRAPPIVVVALTSAAGVALRIAGDS